MTKRLALKTTIQSGEGDFIGCTTSLYGAMAIYVSVGIGIGLYSNVVARVNQISVSFLEIVPDAYQENIYDVAED